MTRILLFNSKAVSSSFQSCCTTKNCSFKADHHASWFLWINGMKPIATIDLLCKYVVDAQQFWMHMWTSSYLDWEEIKWKSVSIWEQHKMNGLMCLILKFLSSSFSDCAVCNYQLLLLATLIISTKFDSGQTNVSCWKISLINEVK